MLVTLAALIASGFGGANAASELLVDDLSCEHQRDPVGIGVRAPRLSWKLRAQTFNEAQTAYHLRAASSIEALVSGSADLWDSGKVVSGQSVLIPWGGKPLSSRSQVFWQVRVWDKDGEPSEWSQTASFELGLLDAASEWKGKWITTDAPRHDIMQSRLANSSWIHAGSAASNAVAVRFGLELPTNATVQRASIAVVADGLITVYVNGQPTQHGSSSRTAPLIADVGTQLTQGTNVIAIGSAAVRNAVRRDRGKAGRNAIVAQGLVELDDGRSIEFMSDGSWNAAVNLADDWFATDFDDSQWSTAIVIGSYASAHSEYVDTTIGPGRYLRKTFASDGTIVKARLYATALGVYQASINGQTVNPSGRFDPGWTDYDKRVMVQTFDVTDLIRPNQNVLGAVVGDGWYAGRVGWMGLAQYGERPAFTAQLHLTYDDGSTRIIATDESWRGGSGAIVGSDMQWGEIIDARQISKWNQPGFDDSTWSSVIIEQHAITLDPQRGPPVRKLLELAPKAVTRRDQKWIVDFGQNLVGFVRIAARGPAGTAITVRHGEMLDAEGSVYTENLRPALSIDTFILAGTSAMETFEPLFTFHGFRYAEVSGYPGDLTPKDIRAIVVGSDMPPVGSWECSDPSLNQLHENIIWSQRGNFLSVPTDCPQRDERMGWMGDALVFAPTAVRNADVAGFFTKWMLDVRDSQGDRGDFPNYAPRVAQPQPGWPVWGDAGVIIPWVMYNTYGDVGFLSENYASMVQWIEFNRTRAKNLILSGGVGDHLAPRRTPTEVVDTAYFANSADIIARSAVLLGKTEDAVKYRELHKEIVEAFNNTFVSSDGTVKGDTQTAYVLALQFDLLPVELRENAAGRLAANVETNGHLTTGFVGVGLICPALTQIDRSDLAWQLVLNDAYPSWLFSVKNGATTIWERWDGWTSERGFQAASMNSFNHYSFGSVGDWLYSSAAGIQLDPANPGYKHFFLRPQFTDRLSYVKASLDSPYGTIGSHWQTDGDQMVYSVTIPPNTSADIELPVASHHIREGGQPLAEADEAATKLVRGAGEYRFTFDRQLLEAAASGSGG